MDKFYKLKFSIEKSNKKYSVYHIIDEDDNNIENIGHFLYSDKYTPVSGSVGLLKSDKYNGYCQLYYTHREIDSYDDNKVTIEFIPAKDKDNNNIFIMSDKECPFCMFVLYNERFDTEWKEIGYLEFD